MWTSAHVSDAQSAWSIRERLTGDANRHPFRLVFDPSPDVDVLSMYDELDHFDADVMQHSSPARLLEYHLNAKRRVVCLTWNLLFEAEIGVLGGYRMVGSAPAHLGVECSLWLSQPSSTSFTVVGV